MIATTPLGVTILVSLVSGLAGALATTWVYVRRENRRYRIDTLKKFDSNRYDLTGDEFSRSLNEIFVAFNDDPAVMSALAQFHQTVTDRQMALQSEDRLLALYKAMCAASGIKQHEFNDSFFLKPFNTRQASSLPNRSSVVSIPPGGPAR